MTTIDRRRFLGLGASAAGALALAGAARSLHLGAAGSPALADAAAPKGSTLAGWTSAVGSKFSVTDAEGRRATLTLQSFRRLSDDPLLTGEGYTALFSGPLHPVLAPTLSSLQHPAMGSLQGVLLAVDKPVAHQSYQLILDNRRPTRPRR